MTPETHVQAVQLESAHRILCMELKQWQLLASPPPFTVDPRTLLLGGEQSQRTPVPIDLWLVFKNGMVKHLEKLIAMNRQTFEAL